MSTSECLKHRKLRHDLPDDVHSAASKLQSLLDLIANADHGILYDETIETTALMCIDLAHEIIYEPETAGEGA
ncbi:MAG: hypothetical protein ABIS07_17315 [Dokdonella sp.]